MAQNYETVALIEPSLTQEEVQGYVDQFAKVVTDHDGEVVHTQIWGRRRMEYPIARKNEAYYFFVYFRMEERAGEVVAELERQARINDEILREMTVKVPELKILDLPKQTAAKPEKSEKPAEQTASSETPKPAAETEQAPSEPPATPEQPSTE